MRIPTVAVGVVAVLGPAAAALSQCEPQTLEPLGMPEGGNFGSGVLMTDQFLLVRNPGEPTLCPDPFTCATGAVHSFELDGGGRWQRLQRIVPAGATIGGTFGSSFDLDGNRLLVGSSGAIVDGDKVGMAVLYEFDGEQWVESSRLYSPDPGFQRGFGQVVALSGTGALVYQDENPGRVFYFEETPDGWELRDDIVSPAGPDSAFGTLELTEDWAFIGASWDDTRYRLGGSVFVYQRIPGEGLEFFQQLFPPDTDNPGPLFGSEIVLSDGTLAVSGRGADREFRSQGVVYVHQFNGGQWELTQELTHQPAAENHNLGIRMDLHGDTLIAGTEEDVWLQTGAAYVFRRGPDGVWSQAARIDPDGRLGRFGFGVATNGERAAVSAPNARFGGFPVGLVHAYDLGCLICKPDLDLDGALTIFDFLVFANLFQDGRSEADFDGDGALTIFDFLAFQDAFQAGCP